MKGPAPDGGARPPDPLPSDGRRRERVLASKQFDAVADVFRNPSGAGPVVAPSAVVPLAREYFRAGGRREPRVSLPVERPHDAWARGQQTPLRATWLGHSTVLLEMDGLRVLTDPVFGERASPFAFAGPKRFHPVPARIAELPRLDAVLLSHDHYDHLCRESASALARLDVPIVTSLGVGAHLERFGVPAARVTELDWGETFEVGGLGFRAVPAQHFSGRGLLDRNRTLWSSWVVSSERSRVFFSGDTGFTTQFEETGRAYGPFDLVMLEIGAYHPQWGSVHLGPKNALEVFAMLGGGALLPVHWGTFNLGLHAWDEPPETLVTLAEARLPTLARPSRLLTPPLGRPFEVARVAGPEPWWRGLEPRPA